MLTKKTRNTTMIIDLEKLDYKIDQEKEGDSDQTTFLHWTGHQQRKDFLFIFLETVDTVKNVKSSIRYFNRIKQLKIKMFLKYFP